METDTTADFTFEAEEIQTMASSRTMLIPSQTQPNYTDFIKHTHIMATGSWASTLLGNTVLGDDLMNDFLVGTASGSIGKKLANFRYFTSKIKISITVQGYSFAYGKLVFWFDPAPYLEDGGIPAAGTMNAYPQKCRSMLIPNIVVDPSKTKVYELILDNPNVFQTWSAVNRLGSFRYGYCVINPLASGQAPTVPAVNFVMHMSLIDPQMSSLSFTSGSFTEGESKKLSDHMTTVSEGFNVLSNIPILSPYATIASYISGAAATFLNFFGFNKPRIETKENMFLAYTSQEVTLMDGKLYPMTVASRSGNTITINPNSIPLCKYEDQILDNISQMYGLVRQFSFTTTNVFGDVLADLQLTPNYSFICDSPVISNGSEPSPMAFVTRSYETWRADFKVRIEIVASVLHRGTILVAYFPDQATNTATITQALDTVRTWEFQIAGNSVHDLEIGYAQPHPYQYNTQMNSVTTSNNGRIKIYIMNPNVSNTTTPIYINVYMAVCNLKMGIPSTQFNALTYSLTSGAIAPSTTSNKVCISDETFYKSFFGETMAHTTKELAMRANQVLYYNFISQTQGASTATVYFPASLQAVNDYNLAGTSGNMVAYNTTIQWLLGSYVGYKGGIIYTFYPSVNSAWDSLSDFTTTPGKSPQASLRIAWGGFLRTLVSNITPAFNVPLNNYGFFTTYGQNQNFTSAHVPYYKRGYYKPSFPIIPSNTLSPQATIQVSVNANHALGNNTTTGGFQMPVHLQLADDAQFVMFRGTPVVIGT